jgi:flagellar protein FlaI
MAKQEGVQESDDFGIDYTQKLVTLPDLTDVTKLDVKYPLLPPYAYAHIKWDEKRGDLLYSIEEPVLSKSEQEVLGLVQIALEEVINVNYVEAKNSNYLLDYLKNAVKSILLELGIKLTKESYQKVMYFVYRDSVGLNEIEPLLNDYYIEDIECNGLEVPVYVVHRKYRNIRTSLAFHDEKMLADFVEKMAQKCGKYVSFSSPVLDGSLPDGSRVNATYSKDITTQGPTFTIRKFTKEPWTPVNLMNQNTCDAKTFAFLWLALENALNMMIVGETGSGKTTFLNAICNFIPTEARICSIEDTREINLYHENWLPAVTRESFGGKVENIDLFFLLRETFRQNPDYLIVGEVRGKEAFVLFQGMASGHPSISTFHAGSVETLVTRLETPPISLPSSLLSSLDLVCVVSHIKDSKHDLRKVKEIDELTLDVLSNKINHTATCKWNPFDDKYVFDFSKSAIFDKISQSRAVTKEQLLKELELREKLLLAMQKKAILNFKEFNETIMRYYKNKEAVLKEFDILQ